jgi:MATE family multidrug resistance protein
MVGHLNAVSLAAAGLATVVFNVLLLYGIGVSYAITPLVAAADGEKDDKSVIDTLRHGIIINFFNGLFLFGVVLILKNLLFSLDQPPEVVERAIPYLNIISASLIPVLIYQSFKQFAEGLSNTRVALIVVMASNVVNVILNYILIYGHFGFPALGLEGAGWATLASRVFMALAIALYVYYSPAFTKFRTAFKFKNYSRTLFGKMLQLGIPSGVQFIFEVAAFDFSLVMMGWLGTKTQAAHQIVINLATLTYMPTAGLAAAATVRVGYFYGSRDFLNLKRSAYTLLTMGLLLMSVCAIIFVVLRNVLPSLYVLDREVTAIASSLLVIAGLFQLADGTQVVCNGALRGLQDVRVPSVFIFISYWVLGLPLGYYLGFKVGYEGIGVWLGLLTGLTFHALAIYFRLRLLLSKQMVLS